MNVPSTNPEKTAAKTVRLALIFTLFMLGLGFVLWELSGTTGNPKPTTLWIRTEPANGVVGQEVTLEAYVGDQRNRPVAGFKLHFIEGTLLGSAATGDDGYARIRHAFDRPGDFRVDVQPASEEKKDFQLMNRSSIEVTIHKTADGPPGSEKR